MATVRRTDKPKRPKQDSVHSMLDKQPPCNVEAEVCVLGSIILRPNVCDEVSMILRAEDFFDEAHRLLYQAMMRMHESGRKVDVALLVDELKNANVFETIGGAAYIAKIANSVPNAAHAEHYANLIREHATRRQLIEAATEILESAYDAGETPSLLSDAEQKIFAIQEGRGSAEVHEVRDVLMEAMDRLDARMKGEHAESATETGFHDLDDLLGGLHQNELIILAARPSMGKTAFALNITEHASIMTNRPVLFVSLEMSRVELADRMLCSLAQVDSHKLRNGTISRDDSKKLFQKANEISEAPLYIDDSPSRTVGEIAAAARRIIRASDTPLGLIAIDYLQLIEPDNPKDPRQEQVAKIARRLKGLARELEVPLLCLAQLNRQAEASKDNRPRLSHLRESGAIEQDADVVMFVHREEYFRSGEERDQVSGEAEIIIAKQRNGPIGDVELLWHRKHTRFVNKAAKNYDEFEQFNEGAAEF